MEATGQEFTSGSLDGLMSKLLAHYDANDLPPPPNLAVLVENYVCNQTPDYCTGTEPATPVFVPGLKHTAGAIFQGTRTIVAWFKGGKNRVTPQEANQRAVICAGCKFNKPAQDCTICKLNSLLRLSERISGGQKTNYDHQLEACTICSCFLKGKVWMPLDDLLPHMTDAQKEALPTHCWLKQP